MNGNGKSMKRRMGFVVLTMALVAFSLLAGCAGGPEQATGPKPGTQSGTRFELSLQPGPEPVGTLNFRQRAGPDRPRARARSL